MFYYYKKKKLMNMRFKNLLLLTLEYGINNNSINKYYLRILFTISNLIKFEFAISTRFGFFF